MRPTGWILCGWPGLAGSWLRGDWFSLFWAMLFAMAVNLSLVVTFVWPELVSSTVRLALWLGVGGCWILAAGVSAWKLSGMRRPPTEQVSNELFVEAQNAYLRGQWYDAEKLLLRLLQQNDADAEARLMLGTLYRHTQRCDLAREQFARLERQESADEWRMEIEHELERLEQQTEQPTEEPETLSSQEAAA